MLRGPHRFGNGILAENLKPKDDAAWVLQSDRGITYGGEVPTGSRLVEGQWWGPDYDGPPLVSFEKKIADGLGLKLGDPIVVNVLGRNITTKIANMRTVDWQSLGINFVMVFSPNAFRGAPHTHLATLTYPTGSTTAQETAIIRTIADAFPMVTTVRVKEALESIGDIVANMGAGDPGRQRRHAAGGSPCAGRRAGRRSSPQGLRRGDPQDARRHEASPLERLYHRVSLARLGHRAVRRPRRIACRLG